MKIAFIGGGNMAAALIGGLIKRGVAPLTACMPSTSTRTSARAPRSNSVSAPARNRRDARRLRRDRAGGETAGAEGRRAGARRI
ncbi:NAD(P)-binding domain-containing protein [Burkholderia ambifaria]|uniref:NAD(P)-binding domain-containing protein n=1 Tax=Burkholderia ambifaria TaxID=152480 RepID=UPI001F2D9680|nr:NAD(P)-binding domain-containing protein [Burkholderia ambifaria]